MVAEVGFAVPDVLPLELFDPLEPHAAATRASTITATTAAARLLPMNRGL